MDAANPTCLGGGNRLPGRAGDDTVQSLADQAATLAATLDVFQKTLSASPGGGWFGVSAAIRDAAAGLADPARVAEAVGKLVEDYREHLKWMEEVLGVRPTPDHALTLETRSRKRLAKEPLRRPTDRAGVSPEDAALELFRWTAHWIRDFAAGDGRAVLITPPAQSAQGGYWPPLEGHDALNVAVEKAGALTRVLDQNIDSTVKGFIRDEYVAQNGWPDPVAAAYHFRYAVKHGHPTELRQLEMLLAGVVMGKLTLRDVPPRKDSLLLDHLVDEYREDEKRLPEFGRVELVHEHRDGDVVLGFNAPHTLLCPTPTADDEKRESAWGALWEALTGSSRPHDWRTEDRDWRYARFTVRQIRTWIEDKKREHGGASPPWTRVFEHHADSAPAVYGWGRALSVRWGADAEAALVDVKLPTAQAGNYWPDEDTPLIAEDALPAEVRSLQTEDSGTFEMVEKFELPDRSAPMRAFWREHLERLQERRFVAAFGSKPDEHRIAFRTADRRSAVILDNVMLLDRKDMMVPECTPMRQEPVPGSSTTRGRIRYPDYPLRSDYFGLVETEDGKCVVDLLKRGESVRVSPPSIDDGSRRQTRDDEGGTQRETAKATWSLRLAGRSDPLHITLPVPHDEDKHHRAHWMVWPRFRSQEKPFWRAYYVYEHCTDHRLRLSTLWLDPDDRRVRRCKTHAREAGSHPIRFDDVQRAHTGGPPIAFELKNRESGQELGLHVITLKSLPVRREDVKIGLDFGTSHTVASVRADGEKHLVELPPEVASRTHDALTLHVSENWKHVKDSLEDNGLEALGNWLPTYTDQPVSKETAGLLPSELLTIEPLASLSGDDPSRWQPGHDCVIPFMNMRRHDLADHLLSDFKWKVSDSAFRDQERALREVYLGMAIELVMADVVWRRLRKFPEQVDFTFTYPLRRDSSEQVKDYERTLRRVTESGTRSLGCRLGLTDDIGIYNESSAAKGGTETFGEVCLVGDLGGGTLDLFISANGGPGVDFKEVADSAKLGGNALLRTMAEHPDRFLPRNEGWADRTSDVQTQLRAWMRSKGCAPFFGDGGAGEAVRLDGLGVAGFAEPSAAKEARALIERYFRLIAEYMTRSLLAYLVRHWYPEVLKHCPDDHGKLRVLVQLRGNGWRLWYTKETYDESERRIAEYIQERAGELWAVMRGDRGAWEGMEDPWRERDLWQEAVDGGAPGPTVAAPTCSSEGSHDANPKAAPILSVVGKAQRHEDIRCHSYALVELALLTGQGPARDRGPATIRWFDSLPVRTGGDGVRVEFHDVRPPFLLSHPEAHNRREMGDLETKLKRRINEDIREQDTGSGIVFNAPVAPLVWEAAFESRKFVKGK